MTRALLPRGQGRKGMQPNLSEFLGTPRAMCLSAMCGLDREGRSFTRARSALSGSYSVAAQLQRLPMSHMRGAHTPCAPPQCNPSDRPS